MRKKLISKTHLKDAKDYKIKYWLDEPNFFASSKKIIDAKPFVTKSGLCLVDCGHTIVEIIPKNELYSMRVFFDKNQKVLQHYFDISGGNGLDAETDVPFYDDMFLDVIVQDGQVRVLDEDEFEEGFAAGAITEEQYLLAKTTLAKLLDELANGTNKYFNMNLSRFLNWNDFEETKEKE